MEDRAFGYISNLSKGMRQRIGLAQALLHSPEVLILDEPTIGLDPAQIIEVRNLIREIGKERTVLLSTHILSEAQQICNRVLIINKGKIVVEDTPEHLQLRLSGAQHVMLRVSGIVDDLISPLQKLKGVEECTASILMTHWKSMFHRRLMPDQILPGLRSKKGFDLLELRAANLSLEEIFLQLTRRKLPAPDLMMDWKNHIDEPDEEIRIQEY